MQYAPHVWGDVGRNERDEKNVVAKTAPRDALLNETIKVFTRQQRREVGLNKRKKMIRILVNVALLVAGIVLFAISAPVAEGIRGYKAFGGEFFLIIAPLTFFHAGKAFVYCVMEAME